MSSAEMLTVNSNIQPVLAVESGVEHRAVLLSEDLRLPTAETRIEYLQAIARGEYPSQLVVSGLPGAGKTTLLSFLESQHDSEHVYTPATRYMPRGRRPSDTVGDQPWRFVERAGDGSDPTGPETVIFSNQKYQGYYAFPGWSIRRAVNRGEIPVMLVTSYSEMTQLVEALHNTMPVAPLVTLRVEVPQEVLPGRIVTRAGAYSNEHRERLEKLGNLVRADLLQTPLLHKVYDTRVIWNVTQDEVSNFGFFSSQVQALTPDAVAAMVVESIVASRDRAACEARDILETRLLTYGMRNVPDAIVDVLDRVLLPAAEERLCPQNGSSFESTLVIKAGLAAAIYLGDQGRPVSPDIDFTLAESPSAKGQMELVMERLCDEMPGWTDGRNKAVYHCEGLKGEAAAKDGTAVELDAILITRVQPDSAGFCFVCQHDDHDLFHRRIVQTPDGNRFGMVPPEQLCVEKLIAGRGPELHKFDLFDAAGLLARSPLNPNLIKKMMEVQAFDADLDAVVTDAIEKNSFQLTPEVLTSIGIDDLKIQAAAMLILESDPFAVPALQHELTGSASTLQNIFATSLAGSNGNGGAEPWECKRLSMKALKQFAFLSTVARSLNKIESIIDESIFPIGNESVSIAERFGADAVRAGIERLRAQIALLAQYHVGSIDSYVHRGSNRAEMNTFFSRLDEQRRRLSES